MGRTLLIVFVLKCTLFAATRRADGFPLFFVPNRGQAPSPVRFMVQRPGLTALLLHGEIELRTAEFSVSMRFDGANHALVVLNLTPEPRDDYRIGVPMAGTYVELLSSDATDFGGSGYPTIARSQTQPVPWHGFGQSLVLRLPPLAAIVLSPEG